MWFSRTGEESEQRWVWWWNVDDRLLFDGAYEAESIIRYLRLPVGAAIVSVDPTETEPEVPDPAADRPAA